MLRGVLGQIRRQPVAFVALFFAVGGTAIAARHYVITSTKQIAP
jgi:hypothetical protein